MNSIEKQYDLIVVGGGLSGMCAAIAAARSGISVALVHNRPVLGGNASSEVRMHICGADDHASRPNTRETGIIEELLLENKYRNPTSSYAIFDSILWEKCAFQPNLTLYLNTHMTQAQMSGSRIASITAVQLTTEKEFVMTAGLFVDATGDGMLGAMCGAEFRLGREGKAESGEKNAPAISDRYTMGNSLMFKARDCGKPVQFVRPDWAHRYTEEQLTVRDHSEITSGYWWIELGGEDQEVIGDGETLRDELLKSVFGVWDHIKNSPQSHGAENHELEWVGFLPGKRESRRLVGDYLLNEHDCYGAARFPDGVAYGGWPMDIHVVGGFVTKSEHPTIWLRLEDVYEIPYRSLYSVNIDNLFLAGRSISCTHMAFASTRVMATCAVAGEAVGVAAAMAVRQCALPRQLVEQVEPMRQELLKRDCYIPGARNADPDDLARQGRLCAGAQLPECPVENLTSGVARTVGETSNCWCAPIGRDAWVLLELGSVQPVQEVRLTFDSNLSREITISLSDKVLARQAPGVPPELITDYCIELLLGGRVVEAIPVQDNHLRHRVHTLPKQVQCDGVRVVAEKTAGSPYACIFEMRVYSQ